MVEPWVPQDVSGYSWSSIASDADGSTLVACASLGDIYVGTNPDASGIYTWVPQDVSGYQWLKVASNADGSILVACSSVGEDIYVGTNPDISGIYTWSSQDLSGYLFLSVASNADGSILVACVYGGDIYVGTNPDTSGHYTWVPQDISGYEWRSVATNADGSRLVACDPTTIYVGTPADTSGNYNWNLSYSSFSILNDVTSSANGLMLAATGFETYIGIYSDASGQYTWVPQNQFFMNIASNADGSQFVVYNGKDIYVGTPADTSGNYNWDLSYTSLSNVNSVTSNANGLTLAACTQGDDIYVRIVSPPDWVLQDVSGYTFIDITSSADGSMLATLSADIYIGINPDINGSYNWILQSLLQQRSWHSIASNANGVTLLAIGGGSLFVGTRLDISGNYNWILQNTTAFGTSVASNDNGLTLAACMNDAIYAGIHPDASGQYIWVQQDQMPYATTCASNANGLILVAGTEPEHGGDLWVGIHPDASGQYTWVSQDMSGMSWSSVASNANGLILAAVGIVVVNSVAVQADIYVGIHPDVSGNYNWVLQDVSGGINCSIGSNSSGSQLIATTVEGATYIGTSTDVSGNYTWVLQDVSGSFQSATSNADGMTLAVAGVNSIYVKTQSLPPVPPPLPPRSGVWIEQQDINKDFINIASSADGRTIITGEIGGGDIYVGIHPDASGIYTLVPQDVSGSWRNFASSADGRILITGGGDTNSDYIYVGINPDLSGHYTWVRQTPTGYWPAFASSADGSQLVACTGADIYVGIHPDASGHYIWIQQNLSLANILDAAMNANGSILAVSVEFGSVYVGIHPDASGKYTWVEQSLQQCRSIASNANGTILVAGWLGLDIYVGIHPDASGIYTWVPQDVSGFYWASVASNADGLTLLATYGAFGGSSYGDIFVGTNPDTSGIYTWTSQDQSGSFWAGVASNADGLSLFAVNRDSIYSMNNPYINALPITITTTTPPPVATWVPQDISGFFWQSVASDADGSTLVSCWTDKDGGDIYVGIHPDASGQYTWVPQDVSGYRWSSVATNADGSQLVACVYEGDIYVGTNPDISGIYTWRSQGVSGYQWQSVASSVDGSILVACASLGDIYVGTNPDISGIYTWVPQDVSGYQWLKVASNADGSILVACVYGGDIYVGTNPDISGIYTWSSQDISGYPWISVATNADGSQLVACAALGNDIYVGIHPDTSGHYTWVPQDLSGYQWQSIATNADGSQLVACSSLPEYIYIGSPMDTSGHCNWVQSIPGFEPYGVASNASGSQLVSFAFGGDIYTLQVYIAPSYFVMVGTELSGKNIGVLSPPNTLPNTAISGFTNGGGYNVAYGNDVYGSPLWVAVGDDSNGNNVQCSLTPTTSWTGVSVPILTLSAVAYGQDASYKSIWIIGGEGSEYGELAYAYNPFDPNGWRVIQQVPIRIYNIAYGYDTANKPLWVAVGIVVGTDESGSNIIYSYNPTDPSGWIDYNVFQGTGTDIAYGKDSSGIPLWIAVGIDQSGNNIQYTYDPTDPSGWNGIYTTATLNSVAYTTVNGRPRWLACGSLLLFSTNPTDISGWIPITIPLDTQWGIAVTPDTNTAVVVGGDSTGYVSYYSSPPYDNWQPNTRYQYNGATTMYGIASNHILTPFRSPSSVSGLQSPIGITAYNDFIYIANNTNNQTTYISKLDVSGNIVESSVCTVPILTTSLAVHEDTMYISGINFSTGRGKIYTYDVLSSQGAPVELIDISGLFPFSIATDDSYLYVLNNTKLPGGPGSNLSDSEGSITVYDFSGTTTQTIELGVGFYINITLDNSYIYTSYLAYDISGSLTGGNVDKYDVEGSMLETVLTSTADVVYTNPRRTTTSIYTVAIDLNTSALSIVQFDYSWNLIQTQDITPTIQFQVAPPGVLLYNEYVYITNFVDGAMVIVPTLNERPLWVATGGSTIQYTYNPTDPSGWISDTIVSLSVYGIAYGQDGSGTPLWLALGADVNNYNILYAYDPTDPNGWLHGNAVTPGYMNAAVFGRDISGKPLWVAVGEDAASVGPYNPILYSRDPTDPSGWRGNPIALPTIRHIIYGNDPFGLPVWVAVGYDDTIQSQNNNTILYSRNPTAPSGWSGYTVALKVKGIAYGQDKYGVSLWVAVGSNINNYNILFSRDPTTNTNTWQYRKAVNLAVTGVAYGRDTRGLPLWVAVGHNGIGYATLYSYDPTDANGWRQQNGYISIGRSIGDSTIVYARDIYGTGMWVIQIAPIATRSSRSVVATPAMYYSYNPTLTTPQWFQTSSSVSSGLAYGSILIAPSTTTTTRPPTTTTTRPPTTTTTTRPPTTTTTRPPTTTTTTRPPTTTKSTTTRPPTTTTTRPTTTTTTRPPTTTKSTTTTTKSTTTTTTTRRPTTTTTTRRPTTTTTTTKSTTTTRRPTTTKSTTTTTKSTTTTTTTTIPGPIPCFVKGTRILTPNGYKMVDDLRKGDQVLTSDKRTVEIKVYTFTLASTTELTAPYRIQSSGCTIGLSGGHAFKDIHGDWQIPMFLAKRNTDIQQYNLGKAVTYYHIECPNYFTDNLIAEGLEVESFRNRQGPIGEAYIWDTHKNCFIRRTHVNNIWTTITGTGFAMVPASGRMQPDIDVNSSRYILAPDVDFITQEALIDTRFIPIPKSERLDPNVDVSPVRTKIGILTETIRHDYVMPIPKKPSVVDMDVSPVRTKIDILTETIRHEYVMPIPEKPIVADIEVSNERNVSKKKKKKTISVFQF